MNNGSGALCRYGLSLGLVIALQARIRDIHPLQEAPFPVAVVENGAFFVSEPDSTNAAYRFVGRESTSMPILNACGPHSRSTALVGGLPA